MDLNNRTTMYGSISTLTYSLNASQKLCPILEHLEINLRKLLPDYVIKFSRTNLLLNKGKIESDWTDSTTMHVYVHNSEIKLSHPWRWNRPIHIFSIADPDLIMNLVKQIKEYET